MVISYKFHTYHTWFQRIPSGFQSQLTNSTNPTNPSLAMGQDRSPGLGHLQVVTTRIFGVQKSQGQPPVGCRKPHVNNGISTTNNLNWLPFSGFLNHQQYHSYHRKSIGFESSASKKAHLNLLVIISFHWPSRFLVHTREPTTKIEVWIQIQKVHLNSSPFWKDFATQVASVSLSWPESDISYALRSCTPSTTGRAGRKPTEVKTSQRVVHRQALRYVQSISKMLRKGKVANCVCTTKRLKKTAIQLATDFCLPLFNAFSIKSSPTTPTRKDTFHPEDPTKKKE